MSAERIAALKQFIEQRPDDPFPRYALAMELKSAGNLDAAASTCQELVTKTPAYVATYLQYGLMLEKLGRIDEARSVLTTGIEQARRAGNAHALSEMEGALSNLD
jgi:tetratricopeptide (TPR) repeat protein